MNFSLLIYQDAEAFAARTDPAKREEFWGSFMPYMKSLQEAGIVVSGAGLESPCQSKTVRLSSEAATIQDGPFADTKEQLGGLFIIDVPDMETALEWASRCPGKFIKSVEVRAVLPPVGS
jgi:hypothetical protein